MAVIIPYKLFTPEVASLQATRLRSAFPFLEAYGVRLGNTSALVQAAELLDEITQHDNFLPPGRTQRQVERALLMAVQVPTIAEALPLEPFPRLTQALRDAIRGSLTTETPAAKQAHAELYAGAVFAAGGAQPQMIPAKKGARSPDYLMRLGDFQFGVEVKSPMAPNTIVSNVEEAVKQGAAYGHQPNVVVVDISDAVSAARDDRCVPAEAYINAVAAFRDKCATAIANRVAAKDARFDHAVGLMMIAQAIQWHGENLTQPAPAIFCAVQRFPNAYQGLVRDGTQRVFDCFKSGTEALGGTAWIE